MKKRFISKLLMAALVVVTMGVFSSCKDYDDDINANTALINQLQTQVDALKTAAAKAQADATQALENAAKAQATADAAKKAAEDAQKAADAAQATGDEALAKAKQGIADAATAQARADEAYALAEQAKAAAADAKREALEKIAEEVEKLDKKIAQKVDQSVFDEAIAKLATKEALQNAIDRFDKELADQVKAVNGRIDSLDKALSAAIAKKVDQSEYDAAIAGINEAIKGLQGKDEELAKLIQANADAIKVNSDSITSFAKYIKAFETQINANKAAIAALDAWIGEKYNSLDDFEKTITAAYETFVTAITEPMQERLDSVVGAVATNTLNIEKLQGDMVTVQGDITNIINNLIPNLKETLEKQINGKADTATVSLLGKNVAKNAKDIKDLFDYLQFVDGKSGVIEGILSQLDELNKLDIDKRLKALEAFKASVEKKLPGMSDSIFQNDKKIKELIEADKQINARIDGLVQDIQTIVTFTNKNITSLVTKPDVWTYGFPTIEATIIEAQPTYKFTGNDKLGKLVSQYTEDAEFIGGANNPTLSGYSFELTAKYWVNPSCVTKDFLKDNYDYWFDEIATKNYITRGNEDTDTAGFKYVRFESYKDSILTVKFKFNKGENVNNANTKYKQEVLNDEDGELHWLSDPEYGLPAFQTNPDYAWVTTIALQATRKNVDAENTLKYDDKRVVTSDYAIVYPTYLQDLLLGNSKYEGEHGDEGNHEWHLNTTYRGAAADDADGLYSFEIVRDELETIDFNDYIDVHYNDCDGVWDNEKAQELGFTFKYTLLTNTDVWNLNGSEISVKEGQNVAANTAEDKAAIVRVELIADGKTYAYGYVTVKLNNTSLDLDLELDLTLKCEYDEQGNPLPFTASYSWAELISKIKTGLGVEEIDWTLCDFVMAETPAEAPTAPNAGPYKKFKEKTSETESPRKGTIKHEGENLVWQFTNAEIKNQFYKDGKPLTEDELAKKYKDNNKFGYYVYLRINPSDKGVGQGFAQINIKVSITSITYPEGESMKDDRIYKYWFKKYTTLIQTDPELREEMHANVETVGQPGNTQNPLTMLNTTVADDEFVIRVTDGFYNKLHDVKNAFVIEPANGFEFSDDKDKNFLYASLYFDANKYYVYKAADNGKNINDVTLTDEQKANTFATGASGAKYLLFLMNANSKYLMAIKEDDSHNIIISLANAQNVVELGSDYNREASFFGRQDPTHDYARDLLNHSAHLELAAGETFTTHMLLDNKEYCLPLAITGNQFDIRWLRPITGRLNQDKEVIDAVDNGATIELGTLVTFEDWRYSETSEDYEFWVKEKKNGGYTSKNFNYFNYYGVKSINPNLDLATTDLNGDWDLLSHFDGVSFQYIPYEAAEGEEILPYADEADFVRKMGYILYQNIGFGVAEFKVTLPVTIEYDWGYTAAVDITVTIRKTEGQPNHIRRN